MPDADDIADAIAENATGPKEVTVDGNRVVQHSLTDQIAAKNAIAATEAVSQPHFGLRFTKLRSPGAN